MISLDKKLINHNVPFFSNIPFIGKRFFSHTYEIESKTDLVIQITPRIVYDNYTGIEKRDYHQETEDGLINNEEEEKIENLIKFCFKTLM